MNWWRSFPSDMSRDAEEHDDLCNGRRPARVFRFDGSAEDVREPTLPGLLDGGVAGAVGVDVVADGHGHADRALPWNRIRASAVRTPRKVGET